MPERDYNNMQHSTEPMQYAEDRPSISRIRYSQDFSNEILTEIMTEGNEGVHLNMDNMMNVMNSQESRISSQRSTPDIVMM